MAAGDVGECLHAEGAGVVHIGRPGLHEHLGDGGDNFRLVADRLAGPLLGNLLGGQVRVPREAAEGVEIGHGQRGAEPVIAAHAGDADHPANRTAKGLARR